MKILTHNKWQALEKEAARAFVIEPRVKNENTKPERGKNMTTQVEGLAKTVLNIGEATAERLNEMQYQIEKLEKVVGRIGAPPGGGSSIESSTNPEHYKAFLNWARSGDGSNDLRRFENSMRTISDPNGGYLIPVELDTEIDMSVGSSVAMRRIATVKTGKGQYKKPYDLGNLDAGWVSEMDARPDTEASELSMFSPPWMEIYACPNCTQALLDDAAFDVANWLSSSISLKFSELEGAAFISGDGSSSPRGITTYDMVDTLNWQHGKIGYVTSGAAASLTADSIIDLQHSLKPVYRQNGIFLMNDKTWAIIRKLKDNEGNYLWAPGLMEAAPDRLLGRPVEIDENMPDIGAGALPIAFADFKRAYLIIDHLAGVRTLRDPFSTRGRVGFYTTRRLASGVYNYQAIRFLKISA